MGNLKGSTLTVPRSPRFQHSVHQIPTPGSENTKPPRYEPLVFNFWLIRGVALLMVCFGVALQIALYFSEKHNGFYVPRKNVFGFVSTQFLTSFFPTLIAIPLAHFWAQADWLLRWYQPYVTLSQGRTPASRSVLLDYVGSNPLSVLYNSCMYRHYLISISGLVTLSVLFLQPLAASLFQVRQVPYTSDSTALLTSTIGLSPTIDNLDGFLASMGFAIASVYDNLIDPPFVHGIWAAGKFQASGTYLNGTLAVNTTAIDTEVNCAIPTSLDVANEGGSYVASATFPNGCSASNVFNPGNGTHQFNVVNASSCALSGLDIKFQPVVFWFYLNTDSPQVASVYCNPSMNVTVVSTSMNLTSSALGPCSPVELLEVVNNVTGSPQDGRPYNGVVFDSSDDFYISSRAQAINFGIPDAIYRYASRQPGGPLSVFQDKYGFLNATTTIYTQHLSVAAQTNFFLPSNSTTSAKLTTQTPRLFIEKLPALILSPLLIVIGLVGFWIQYLHRRARRRLWLTSPPGSIAAVVSLTSRSGFGQLLLPYDDESRMRDNLAGLEFRIDERTGAIVAEEDELSDYADGHDDSIPLKRADNDGV